MGWPKFLNGMASNQCCMNMGNESDSDQLNLDSFFHPLKYVNMWVGFVIGLFTICICKFAISLAADVILLKRRQISFGVIIVATAAWLIFDRSGLSFLTISSDVLLILIVVQFVRVNSAVLLSKQLQPLPELILSEEMVNNAAASFRVKVNNMLLMAHDITLGKDFRLFFQVVVFLWLFSVVGSFFSFFTLAYIGTIVSITIPALYNKYEAHVDRYAGFVHQNFSKHYKVVNENVIRRLPRRFSMNKDL